MRSAAAVLMTVLLMVTVGACVWMCGAPGTVHSCCNKHQSGGTPCAPNAELRPCAFTMLERGRPGPAVSLAITTLAPAFSAPVQHGHVVAPPQRLVDSGGLFLKNRILLI